MKGGDSLSLRDAKEEASLWAITSFFNPAGYRRRLVNFRQFHQALEVPLVAVEWSPKGAFEFQPGDAEILVQVSTGDILWQKERLLNIGLHHLPDGCRYVAWLDCDVIFGQKGWSDAACRLMENYPLIQLFNEAFHLPASPVYTNPRLDHFRLDNPVFRETCLVAQYFKGETGPAFPSRTRLTGNSYSGGAPGMAWAARRKLLETCGLYDACIVGGGDTAMARAAFGEWNAAAVRLNMTSAHKDHYLQWASSFFKEVKGDVSNLSSPVYHLWHGNFADRRYKERYEILRTFGFNPKTDLRPSSEGGWLWTDQAPGQLRRWLEGYFKLRREDDDMSG